MPDFCQDLGEGSELTPNAWRVASELRVYSACATRMYVGLARSAQVWRPFGAPRTCSKTPDAHSEWRRMHGVGPALVSRTGRTSNEGWRTPNARQRTDKKCKFAMPGPRLILSYHGEPRFLLFHEYSLRRVGKSLDSLEYSYVIKVVVRTYV